MKTKKEESYQLTFKGFISLKLNFDVDRTQQFIDEMELWLRRLDNNAVILGKSGEFETHKVYLEDK
jgi:hypothetical protein